MKRRSENIVGPDDLLLQKYGLRAGAKVALEKIDMRSSSATPVGYIAEGIIQNEVKIGEPISFDNGSRISEIIRVEEREGELLIRTTTSTYRLRPETSQIDENFELEDVAMVETAKGSTYRYLPDGTTQRFKKVEGKEYEPQAALVYIPDYAWVQQNASPEILAKLGGNEIFYIQTILKYVQNPNKAENRKTYIVDQAGKIIETNQEIKDTKGPIYLNFLSGGKADFFIPVSHKPKIGFMTFDTRRYKDEETGEDMRERHLGNSVVKILLKNNN